MAGQRSLSAAPAEQNKTTAVRGLQADNGVHSPREGACVLAVFHVGPVLLVLVDGPKATCRVKAPYVQDAGRLDGCGFNDQVRLQPQEVHDGAVIRHDAARICGALLGQRQTERNRKLLL
eukprot:CAMPEP_0117551014 /NCGR_PEP_ID=MMETSP0784-20121206/48973_1 /TAXON_ID=39447 /ORGANISM="" /LENGTH=119 /DNA_ID=CAMNT_0005348041 /DNA_START=359 /DNA_END=718 /DNA_ORIENTATION=-